MMKHDILSMTLAELEAVVLSIGEPKFRAKQIYGWMLKGAGFDEMRNVSQKTVDALKEGCELRLPSIVTRLDSALDGTKKYLFELNKAGILVLDTVFDADVTIQFALLPDAAESFINKIVELSGGKDLPKKIDEKFC